ncbi:MAG TPA: PmoA family protein [Phycisphaerae bacterium]|nr:PmoA family protein [Phycisphaerae bacterium]HPU26710.1 PmoA family protein [Phycisphaerae bacterium]
MDAKLSRRDALKAGGTAAVGVIALRSVGNAAGQTPPPADIPASNRPGGVLSAYQCDRNIWVRIDDAVFCCYRAGADQKYPYFYPLTGPATGMSVTEESSVPWPHHRSLFFGCDHVNGGNYWQDALSRGQIVSRGPRIESADERAVLLADVCDWRRGDDEPIIEDRRTYRITAPDASTRILDCRITLTARTDIQITKTNHSLFAVRAARGLAPLGGGRLLNSAGQSGEKATFGQPASWCGFEGVRFGQTESIVLMDDPQNPWYPCQWFTRDYGFASPTPFFWIDEKEPWRLPKGQTLALSYRVAVLAGPLDRARLDCMHRDWSSRA